MRDETAKLKQYRGEGSYKQLLSLLRSDLQMYREKSDSVTKDLLQMNQGAIMYIKGLLKDLGFDPDKKPMAYDAGYVD